MADTSPYAEVFPYCEICGCSLAKVSKVGNRCTPCFWARTQDKDPREWGAKMVGKCEMPNCPFDVVTGSLFCTAHQLDSYVAPDVKPDPSPKLAAIKFDSEKLPLDLLPFEALEEITLVLQHGAKKYEAHNWRKGFMYSRPFAAILRHLFAYWKGEDLDKDSGLHHLAHAGCELLFLLSFVKTKTGVDDRYVPISNS